MASSGRKTSTATARSHTRRKNQSSSSFSIPTSFKKLLITIFAVLLALSYQAIQPPPPKPFGSPNGPLITSPRIKLKDGRHISYYETGVPKEKAKHKIIFLHGLTSCKYDVFPIPKETADKYGIYMLSFDRPGYGDSDPHPGRSVKSNTQDIEELADLFELGDKFYIMGYSLGGELAWGCMKYIPHRLAGAALLAPVSNFHWRSFPSNLTNEVFRQISKRDRWAYRVAHYAPWLTYWWNTQKWFPSFSVLSGSFDEMVSPTHAKLTSKLTDFGRCGEQARQQGEFESIFRDINIAFGTWGFDPMELENPIPGKGGMFHLWQGDEDRIVSVHLARFLSQKLSWITYHELPNTGHIIGLQDGIADHIFKTLVAGQNLN